MNSMKKMALLLLLAAASNGAKALDEVIRLQAGIAFTLHSSTEAVGTGLPPKYQWYRDGTPIEGATSPGYTIPTGQAVGSNVQFKRAAYTDGCAERMFTNTIAGSAKGNAVAGRFYGYNHATCILPGTMAGCVCFPAVDYRDKITGALTFRGSYGYAWSSTQTSSTNGFRLAFFNEASSPYSDYDKANAIPVRCVQ